MTNKKEIAIYETDVQEDFSYRGGALFVNGQKPWSNKPYGAEAVLSNIFAIHNNANQNGWRTLGSVDLHFYEDAELIRNEGGVFDDHCMNGTLGQLRLEELNPQKDVYVRNKDGPMFGTRKYSSEELQRYVDSNAQIIFEKQSYDVDTNPNFKSTLRKLIEAGLRKIIFNGFATDYCVKAGVLATAKYRNEFDADLELYVVTDAVEEVNIDFQGNLDMEFGKNALEEMVQAGAKLVITKDILEGRI